ncbi:MAG: flagellar assembly protein FliH [Proteobacteria bacterium]|nr:flagellar assembly protein FliH [Pseudomonadota bacterium]
MAQPHTSFTFGRDFTRPEQRGGFDAPRRVPVVPAEHDRLVELARSEGYEAGVAEGRRLQADHEAIRLASCLEALTGRLDIALIEMRRLEDVARNEALTFARLFSAKLSGALIASAPVTFIEDTAAAIFQDLRGSPHLAVRVEPSLVDACKAELSKKLKENGLETKLFVFPDPDVALGDCRIEWADGGIVRDRKALEAAIDRVVETLFPNATTDTDLTVEEG